MCSFISQATTQGLSHRNLLEATGQTVPCKEALCR